MRVQKEAEGFVKSRTRFRDYLFARVEHDRANIEALKSLIISFNAVVDAEASQVDKAEMKRYVKMFEGAVHEELSLLFRLTDQELSLMYELIEAMARFRDQLKVSLGDDVSTLAQSELIYANKLVKHTQERVETLSLLSKKLKK